MNSLYMFMYSIIHTAYQSSGHKSLLLFYVGLCCFSLLLLCVNINDCSRLSVTHFYPTHRAAHYLFQDDTSVKSICSIIRKTLRWWHSGVGQTQQQMAHLFFFLSQSFPHRTFLPPNHLASGIADPPIWVQDNADLCTMHERSYIYIKQSFPTAGHAMEDLTLLTSHILFSLSMQAWYI